MVRNVVIVLTSHHLIFPQTGSLQSTEVLLIDKKNTLTSLPEMGKNKDWKTNLG